MPAQGSTSGDWGSAGRARPGERGFTCQSEVRMMEHPLCGKDRPLGRRARGGVCQEEGLAVRCQDPFSTETRTVHLGTVYGT